MAGYVFITGARGFIGKALVSGLLATGAWHIRALVRRPVEQAPDAATELTWVIGDLLDPETYQASLEGIDTVIHLAATTGKAARRDHERTNVEGTGKLLEACKAAGVRRFLHLSTIAVKYSDQRWYPYAKTKARVEVLVRESRIPSTIIRPTIVIGARSPIWHSLSRMAKLPVIPLPNGGRVCVQPIHVDDLVQGIVMALSAQRLEGETLELGGAAPMSFANFMGAIHKGFYGKQPRLMPVPLLPIRVLLALLEPLARQVMPLTAGQLAVFANDSTVTGNWLHDSLKGRMRSTEEIIAGIIADAKYREDSPAEETAPRNLNVAVAGDASNIDCECDVFGRYLVNETPTEYIRRQYRMGMVARGFASDDGFSTFDRVTLNIARRCVLCTRFADAYCAIFHRHGALRRKLILLLAIMEHTAPISNRFDRPIARGAVGSGAYLFLQGASFFLSFIIGTLLLLPAQFLSFKQPARNGRGRGR